MTHRNYGLTASTRVRIVGGSAHSAELRRRAARRETFWILGLCASVLVILVISFPEPAVAVLAAVFAGAP